MTEVKERRKLSIRDLRRMKEIGEPFAVATAFDYVTVRMLEEAEIEVICPSDWSLATTVLGMSNTMQLNLDDMLFYLSSVARQVKYGFILGPLPYGSYEVSNEQAVRNATLFLKSGADAVTVQGSGATIDRIRAMSEVGIICIGHLGVVPQRQRALGDVRVTGLDAHEAAQIVRDARATERAGAWGVILESVPDEVSEYVNRETSLVTIAAGITTGCDGQMLTTHGMLGFPEHIEPSFRRQYLDFRERATAAIGAWLKEVQNLEFPTDKQTFRIKDEQYEMFLDSVVEAGG